MLKRTSILFLMGLLVPLFHLCSSTGTSAIESGITISRAISAKWTGDYEGMLKRRAIRVLISYSKTDFFIDQKGIRGYAVEMLREFEKTIQADVKSKVSRPQMFLIPTSRNKLIPKLISGEGDVAIANLTVTKERRRHADFSDPFIRNVQELLVTGKSIHERTGVNDLVGIELVVRRSSSYFSSLNRINRVLVSKGEKAIAFVEASKFLEDEDLLEMVHAGLINGVIVDSHKADFWIKRFDNLKVHRKVVFRNDGDIAWMFRKDSPKLKEKINAFAKKARAGTVLGNILTRRYYSNIKWLQRKDAKRNIEKLEKLEQLFRKYGKQYRIDWLIIAAQSFKESQFDQAVVGPTGAIGVMQIKKKTAASKEVDIPNIESLENNIHAGTKYLRYLADQYFPDKAITPFNRIMLALAAYNAGPNRIEALRKKAEDPNVWFGSVETVVAREVNQIPVRYVLNIAQYYEAFRLRVELQKKSGNVKPLK